MTGWIKRFKSPWYYWYTGHLRIAVISLAVSTLVLGLVFGATVGFSMVGILLAVVLDTAGLALALLYVLVLRAALPEWMGLRDNADAWILSFIVWPFFLGVFVNRLVTFGVATISGYIGDPQRTDRHHSASTADE
ncbi:MAG: hypothetical protein KDJ28_16385 [Candidatus Competibacteraceae bacterium]|nr:hypothetical protein [Candidatus Competibacteraceae bacterium]